jgi:hypothetical protein
MTEPTLPPEIVERVCEELLLQHPEMAGAEVRVSRRRRPAGQAEVSAKIGLPAVELPEEPLYTVTLRKEARTEDGVIIPLTVRVTVDAEGRTVKSRQRH